MIEDQRLQWERSFYLLLEKRDLIFKNKSD